MNMGSSTVYTRPEGETTEWEDILRAKGITGPSEAELRKKAAEELEAAAEEAKERIDPLSLKSLGELDRAAEEDDEFADSRILESYRAKRLAEIKAAAVRNRFGEVWPLARHDFVREVTDASKESWVIVFLHQEHVADSKLLERVLPRVAAKHRAVKFMSIRADACIEGYPDRNVPTLLLYHDGALHSQIVGLAELDGKKVSPEVIEWVLSRKGVVTTDMLDDPRDKGKAGGGAAGGGGGGRGFTRRFGRDDSDRGSDSE